MEINRAALATADAAESLARARAGDADAFCRVIEPCQDRLLRQAAALSGDLAAAEDLVAETLVEAWKSLSRFDGTCRLSTWLYAILWHRYQKWKSRSRSRPLSLAWLSYREREEALDQRENVPSAEPSPAEDAARNERSAMMRALIAQLPEKHQQIILLRFFADASLPDMARVLDCPVGTVKSRLHHALDKLRALGMNLPDLGKDIQI